MEPNRPEERKDQPPPKQSYSYPAWVTKYALYGGIASVGLALFLIKPFFAPKKIVTYAAGRIAGSLVSLMATKIFWAAWKARGMVDAVKQGKKPT